MPVLRRLALALLGVLVVAPGLLVLGGSGPASAAADTSAGTGVADVRSAPRATETVTDVFSGTVAAVRSTIQQGGGGRTSYIVTVETVFSGPVDTRRVSVVARPAFTRCASGALQRGSTYVFSLTRPGGAMLVASTCTSVTPASPTVLRTLATRFPDAHPPVVPRPAPTPVRPVLEPVPASDPTPLARLAAPGVALVLIGLLGLVVVRRAASPRRR